MRGGLYGKKLHWRRNFYLDENKIAASATAND